MAQPRRCIPHVNHALAAVLALAALTASLAGCSAGSADSTSTTRAATLPTTTSQTTATTTTGTTTTGTTASATSTRWKPAVGTSWQWQLTGTIDTSVNAAVYDVDGFDVPASTVAALHAKGRKVVCYIDVGSWENWRADTKSFPSNVLGKSNGWAGEKWLDIRRQDILGPIMAKRFDLCASKGFDAVEPDNVDGYANSTGFPLTGASQISYNTFIAGLAHARGMSVALKNDTDQVRQLQPSFDFAVNEECYAYQECSTLTPFISAGKAVLHVEYSVATTTFCPATTKLGFSSMRKHTDLGAWRQAC